MRRRSISLACPTAGGSCNVPTRFAGGWGTDLLLCQRTLRGRDSAQLHPIGERSADPFTHSRRLCQWVCDRGSGSIMATRFTMENLGGDNPANVPLPIAKNRRYIRNARFTASSTTIWCVAKQQQRVNPASFFWKRSVPLPWNKYGL